jgi:hypothetical protein
MTGPWKGYLSGDNRDVSSRERTCVRFVPYELCVRALLSAPGCLWVHTTPDSSLRSKQVSTKRCDQAMPAIGASLRKWTLCLLLCSVPTPACTQPTNETAVVESHATATTSTSTLHPSAAAASSIATVRLYRDAESTCPFRTINYITQTLPQQCAKATHSPPIAIPKPEEAGPSSAHEGNGISTTWPQTEQAVPVDGPPATGTANDESESESELETDSPLDNANFLSFEEWKTRNLAEAGQSPENVGQGRAVPSNQPGRRRPVNVNALDSLGDEAEIELDFSGFGPPLEGGDVANNNHAGSHGANSPKTTDDEKKGTPSSWALSKDAGKTCKERFNYASFDCAATVLKTNKQAKSATSVLVENKDSYMLNECKADNKFLIVELCDDILVDTVVLANYEFFSSMFRHFRVSVSDRYPVKMERWKTLATFEARNSRDMQPFLITEPQIWARYVRIEFLTQYGNEFYCPLSLLRVHGTTMMEQFRREEEEARGVDDYLDLETEQEVIKPAVDSGPLPADQVPILPVKNDSPRSTSSSEDSTAQSIDSSSEVTGLGTIDQQPATDQLSTSSTPTVASPTEPTTVLQNIDSAAISSASSSVDNVSSLKNVSDSTTKSQRNAHHDTASASSTNHELSPSPKPSSDSAVHTSAGTGSKNASTVNQGNTETIPTPASNASAPKVMGDNTAASPSPQLQQRGSATQPGPATPSTQESFFKSIHKRLVYLEANSTLSLQYIEEQSRILRDAFKKVEKRQLVKTEKFLDHLNSTVMQELKSFRTMYDQLWQSTVIELESMKERQKNEMGEIGSRLSIITDELVWQKRMAVVQSTLLLLCLGLVLFVRSGTLGSAADVPIVQQLGSKYTNFFESSPPRSPPESGIARRRRTFKNMWRSDASIGLSDHHSDDGNVLSDVDTDGARSPVDIEYSPPTPTTPGDLAEMDFRDGVSSPHHNLGAQASTSEETSSPDDQAKRLEALETQSGPATPNGTRDSRPSWEEVDRAIDQMKAQAKGQLTPRSRRKDKKKKRSPLRRAQSSYDCTADGSTNDTGEELFSS